MEKRGRDPPFFSFMVAVSCLNKNTHTGTEKMIKEVSSQEVSRDSSPSSLYIDFGLFLLVFSSRERRETRRSVPQTSRLSSSSTPRLIKVPDIRLLWGKSLDRRINLLSTNTFVRAQEDLRSEFLLTGVVFPLTQ